MAAAPMTKASRAKARARALRLLRQHLREGMYGTLTIEIRDGVAVRGNFEITEAKLAAWRRRCEEAPLARWGE